jgi:putative glutamine amidotransferase
MMTKPLIGLTTTRTTKRLNPPSYGTNLPYVQAVTAAGGLPVMIPSQLAEDDLDQLLARLDGVLFTGGYDIDPACYGHPQHPLAEKVDASRDHLETRLVQSLARSGRPFFGICRGLQIINVALGGSLYEHLPGQLPGNVHLENHARPRDYLAHTITVHAGSRLEGIVGEGQRWVNSLHHQGVRDLAAGLQVSATAPDGLVEAFELPGHPFGLAVQWHPEELLGDLAMRKLFEAFIQACQVRQAV